MTTHLDEDLEARRLVEVPLDLFRVFARAQDLSLAHSSSLLCRTLDILHVASALELRCSRLVSADERQLRLSRAAGLAPADIRRRRT